MPPMKGDAMRGLAVFISDIRNCKSKEAEIKRINKELANIRSKFKGSFLFVIGIVVFLFGFESQTIDIRIFIIITRTRSLFYR